MVLNKARNKKQEDANVNLHVQLKEVSCKKTEKPGPKLSSYLLHLKSSQENSGLMAQGGKKPKGKKKRGGRQNKKKGGKKKSKVGNNKKSHKYKFRRN